MTQNPSHKTKLDIVADSIQCSTEDILAYGDVKLFVYYNEEAQKGWQDANLTGTAAVHMSKSRLGTITLTVTNLLTRQVVFRCRCLHSWTKQYDYWYSFPMSKTAEPHCPYLASLHFKSEDEGIRFHSIVSALTENLKMNQRRQLQQQQQQQQQNRKSLPATTSATSRMDDRRLLHPSPRHSRSSSSDQSPRGDRHSLEEMHRSPLSPSSTASSSSQSNRRSGRFRSKISHLFSHGTRASHSPSSDSPSVVDESNRPTISTVTGFSHVSGYNSTNRSERTRNNNKSTTSTTRQQHLTMDQVPSQLRKILEEANITDRELRDPAIADFVRQSIGTLSVSQPRRVPRGERSTTTATTTTTSSSILVNDHEPSRSRTLDPKGKQKEELLIDFSTFTVMENPPEVNSNVNNSNMGASSSSTATSAQTNPVPASPNPFDEEFEPDFSVLEQQHLHREEQLEEHKPQQPQMRDTYDKSTASTTTSMNEKRQFEYDQPKQLPIPPQPTIGRDNKEEKRFASLESTWRFDHLKSTQPVVDDHRSSTPTIDRQRIRSKTPTMPREEGVTKDVNTSISAPQRSTPSPALLTANNVRPVESSLVPLPPMTAAPPPPPPGPMPEQTNEPPVLNSASVRHESLQDAIRHGVTLKPTLQRGQQQQQREQDEQLSAVTERTTGDDNEPSLLLKEILSCKLRHVTPDMMSEHHDDGVHHDEMSTFASSLADLIKARRSAILGDDMNTEQVIDQDNEDEYGDDDEDDEADSDDWL